MSYPKLIIRAALATIAGLGIAGSSWAAGTATASLTVSTHVIESCVVTLPVNLAFPAYDPLAASPTVTNGSITLTCTKGSNGVTVAVDNGLHAAGSQRNMVGTVGGENLPYSLFQPSAVGGTATATATAFATASTFAVPPAAFATGSTAVLVKIFGSIPINQDVTGLTGAGNAFADTVVATVSF